MAKITVKRNSGAEHVTTDVEARPVRDDEFELIVDQTTYKVATKRYAPRKIVCVVLTRQQRDQLIADLGQAFAKTIPAPMVPLPKIAYRDHLIVSYYVRGEATGNSPWLPPNDATDDDCSRLVKLGLLKRAPAPNADCFQITEAGRIRRYTVEGE